ncbi:MULTISPECIES: hypothetical protein, partial [unclassified Corynebacterium]|uniref:hypothetical protein n=1 Tax=unclassified Corynebacterium TaxID=2624378 RepID=UPI00210950E9
MVIRGADGFVVTVVRGVASDVVADGFGFAVVGGAELSTLDGTCVVVRGADGFVVTVVRGVASDVVADGFGF